jgi:hypothetical protein
VSLVLKQGLKLMFGIAKLLNLRWCWHRKTTSMSANARKERELVLILSEGWSSFALFDGLDSVMGFV